MMIQKIPKQILLRSSPAKGKNDLSSLTITRESEPADSPIYFMAWGSVKKAKIWLQTHDPKGAFTPCERNYFLASIYDDSNPTEKYLAFELDPQDGCQCGSLDLSNIPRSHLIDFSIPTTKEQVLEVILEDFSPEIISYYKNIITEYPEKSFFDIIDSSRKIPKKNWAEYCAKKKISQKTQSLDSKNPRKAILKNVQREVWRRDQGKCVACGSQRNLEFDHVIPVKLGGSSTARNIQLLCEKCNRTKGASEPGTEI